jgi:CDP-glucose 4,6-dehydratase
MSFANVYRGCRVLVTGHTGFKGSWLTHWLQQLGAEVAGYSLGRVTEPSNFEILGLEARMRHYQHDIRDHVALARALDEFQPEIVFHLAAQALVRQSYAAPAETFEVNTMGMVNLLECLRERPSIGAAVLITSDKAYRNDEWCWGYRETDALGGHDPYSGSKSCAELVAHSYHHSYFRQGGTRIATTRAGNVIGGGDWAADRIVPDCVKAWTRGESVLVRSPHSTRPWQHVLEPLSGYLWLGAKLLGGQAGLNGEAFNFGPDANVNQTVGQLIDAMAKRWPAVRWHTPDGQPPQAHEAMLLKLSCDKALFHLGWRATLLFEETVEFTIDWYRAWHESPATVRDVAGAQIDRYTVLAASRNIPWSRA